MSKGLSRWSRWTAVLAVAVGVSLVASAWAGEAKGKTQNATNAVAEVSAQGEVSAITARLQEVEAQLSKVEDRFEDYRRSQDNALKEMFVQWSGLLIAPIRERFNENAKKELESIREQNKFVLDANGKAQGNAVAELRTDLSEHVKNQWKSIAVFGFALLLIFIAGVAVLCRKVRRKMIMTSGGLYRIEMFLLMGVILLIFWGTFQLLTRIIDFGASGSSIYAIASPECNQAVLQAYEQLSNELGRWCALFGVLGSFFGLVLPVGAYLLQLKAVNREEEKAIKLIKEEVREFNLQKKQIEERLKGSDKNVQQMIDGKIRNVEAEIEDIVQKIMKEFAAMQKLECSRTYNMIMDQPETVAQTDAKEWLWRQLLAGIVLEIYVLEKINSVSFVKGELQVIINRLNKLEALKICSDVQEKIRGMGNNKTWKIISGAVSLRKHLPKEMAVLEELLAKYGIAHKK